MMTGVLCFLPRLRFIFYAKKTSVCKQLLSSVFPSYLCLINQTISLQHHSANLEYLVQNMIIFFILADIFLNVDSAP